MKYFRLFYPYLLVIFIAITAASINFSYGISGDIDSYFVVQHSQGFPGTGFFPSRSWGFPVYELVIYPILNSSGVLGAKVSSLFFYVIACVLFLRILEKVTPKKVEALIASIGFCLLPVSIISGNTILETSQGLCLAFIGILFYIQFIQTKSDRFLIICSLILGLGTASRPEYIVLFFSIVLYTYLTTQSSIQKILKLSLPGLVIILLSYIFYTKPNFTWDVIFPDPIPMKLARAVVGMIALFGIPACFVIFFVVIARFKKWKKKIQLPGELNLLISFAGFTLLYLIRFAILPDELEYIYILVPLLIILLVHLGISHTQNILLAVALILPNFYQIHFWEMDTLGNLSVSFGGSPGAIFQDRETRKRLDYINNVLPKQLDEYANQLGYASYYPYPMTNKNALIFIQSTQLRFYSKDRFGGSYYRAACNQKIIYYPMQSDRGWRQFIKYRPWKTVSVKDFQIYQPVGCP